jgi:methionyl-tRNA synthetase
MGLNLVHLFAHLSWPVMPKLAETIHLAIQPIGYDRGVVPWIERSMAEALDDLTPGQPITPPEVLIAKITDEQVEELKIRFGGGAA